MKKAAPIARERGLEGVMKAPKSKSVRLPCSTPPYTLLYVCIFSCSHAYIQSHYFYKCPWRLKVQKAGTRANVGEEASEVVVVLFCSKGGKGRPSGRLSGV